MIKILILLLCTALGTLRVLSPPGLVDLYTYGIVPSITADIETNIIGSVKSAAIFLPSSKWCNYTYVEGYINIIIDTDCERWPSWEDDAHNVTGIVLMMNASDSELNSTFIPAEENGSMFIVGISNEYINSWKNYSRDITLQFYPDIQKKPTITIALSGNSYDDEDLINDLYKSLIPIGVTEVNIELLFNYYSCYNCSAFSCYSMGKYCLGDSSNYGIGMIDRTLYEMALLQYSLKKEKYLGKFAMFLRLASNYCHNDYSDSCHDKILKWLDISPKSIKSIIKNSWSGDKNSFGINSLINNQMEMWEINNFSYTPLVLVNNEVFDSSNLTDFISEICIYWHFSAPVCSGMCNKNCYIANISNIHCESSCETNSCAYDVYDCKIYEDLNESNSGTESGLSVGGIIALSICLQFGLGILIIACIKCKNMGVWDKVQNNFFDLRNPPAIPDDRRPIRLGHINAPNLPPICQIKVDPVREDPQIENLNINRYGAASSSSGVEEFPEQNLQKNVSINRLDPILNAKSQWLLPLATIENSQEIQQAIDFYNQYVCAPPIQNAQQIQQAIDFYNQYGRLPSIQNSQSIQLFSKFYYQFNGIPSIQNIIGYSFL